MKFNIKLFFLRIEVACKTLLMPNRKTKKCWLSRGDTCLEQSTLSYIYVLFINKNETVISTADRSKN